MTDAQERDESAVSATPPDPPQDQSDDPSAIVPGPSGENRWGAWWQESGDRLKHWLSFNTVAELVTRWFSVDEAEIAQILATVRAELPTTEVLLLGKSQAGKSSIVRGLTGVAPTIVGQGFRPHTQHTERYAYPSGELPLLIFTDTVGLGDIRQETQAVIEELSAELAATSSRARMLVLVVKATDFATDTLHQIAVTLRQQYPTVPCLLAITSLHEVYPPLVMEHPAYPPSFAELNRAVAAIQSTFAPVCDRTVLLDFTLEEDGYEPVFYGLEALRDALTELLPEAEARTIHQLLDDGIGQKLGNLYRDVGRRYLLAFAIAAGTLAAVPLPFATMPVLTALQVSMVGLLGQLYGQTLTPSQAGGLVSAIAAGFLGQAIGRELIKFIPGLGSVIAASWAAAYTWALGEAACVYFGDLMGGKKPDPKRIQQVMQDSFTAAKDRFKHIQRSPTAGNTPEPGRDRLSTDDS